MIIVTGTKRSGTSMWMQLLKEAGLPPIGAAFPKNWEKTIKDANPAGFYESDLRYGIYYETNPHPKSGVYLFPEQTRNVAVKVFVPGLIRSDRAFIDKVIATVRPWRQYVSSLRRLYSMEDASLEEKRRRAGIPKPSHMPAHLEWWQENFSLVSDIVTRRYPFYMVSYESVLEDPESTLKSVFNWLGTGDVDKAIAQVNSELRTQQEEPNVGDCALDASVIQVFDEFYDVVKSRRELTQSFVDKLNETQEKLEPALRAASKEVATANERRKHQVKLAARKRKKAKRHKTH